MNEIVNRFLLTGDKFIPEIHLKQPSVLEKLGFTNSACGRFTKNKEKKQKLKETGDSASEQVLLNKVFDIAKNSKYDRYKRGIASMAY